jgi:hypothetical protein
MASNLWSRDALCNTESPRWSRTSTSAPRLSSNSMTSSFPLPEASWNGVELDLSRTFTSAPPVTRSFTASNLWHRDALRNGESPRWSKTFEWSRVCPGNSRPRHAPVNIGQSKYLPRPPPHAMACHSRHDICWDPADV